MHEERDLHDRDNRRENHTACGNRPFCFWGRKQRKKLLKNGTFAATIVISIASVAQGFFTAQSVRSQNKAVALSQEQFEVSQSAVLSTKSPQIEFLENPDQIRVTIPIENGGQTTADAVSISNVTMAMRDPTPEMLESYNIQMDGPPREKNFQIPSHRTKNIAITTPLSDFFRLVGERNARNMEANLKSGNMSAIVGGHIKYRTMFGKQVDCTYSFWMNAKGDPAEIPDQNSCF